MKKILEFILERLGYLIGFGVVLYGAFQHPFNIQAEKIGILLMIGWLYSKVTKL